MTNKGLILDDDGKMNNFAIEPTVYVDDQQRIGFTPYAERLNGRLAMIGFVSLLALEVSTKHGLITWLTHI
ncbi:MAG: chlorophyll a/b-binding protein [Tychonema bourrellyi B0820]|uniref:High light inducible protein n=1 Tax=Tychonema bourrellyi FEM_GT703 TaxID=2040638 RepID=A0A2G4F462_9CYAN|nr:chlorophyll a/b-binding protein [Tychonema bourrellyi]MDQ2096408.1 chlorophyll a/b-binding protein [Tychonema bourrellyi B0820]PHX56525.1 high light inducible protein [Tychonema bourrellyi FEM_GT703]